MALTIKEIESIAHLARLGLQADELEHFAADVSNVLDMVTQLQAIDTDGVEPMAHPGNATLTLRADKVLEHATRDQLQAAAPDIADGYFLVPRVIE